VAVRPEAIRVEAQAGGSSSPADNRVSGRITNRTFLGQSVTLDVTVGASVIHVIADPESAFVPGDEVTLVFPVRRCVAVRAL
jgi:hypothetical protein